MPSLACLPGNPLRLCLNFLDRSPDLALGFQGYSDRRALVSIVQRGLGFEIVSEIAAGLEQKGSESTPFPLEFHDLAVSPLVCYFKEKVLTWVGLHMFQMLFDEDRSLERTSGDFALGVTLYILRWRSFLFFYANEHFREKETF